MTPQAKAQLADVAYRLTALMMPFVLGAVGWVATSVMAHESRLDVVESMEIIQHERLLQAYESVGVELKEIKERLRRIEIRMGEGPK